MSLVHFNFESQYLNCNTDINVILPDKPRDKEPVDFYKRENRYKVLWLLHGTFGDYTDWVRKSNIELYACEKNLIVVMPSGLNANYSDWGAMMGINMFSYLTEELMPLIHNWFPASDKREDNFISGLSMGGEGALKYRLNHPDKFAGVAVLSMFAPDWENYNGTKGFGSERDKESFRNAGGYDKFVDSYQNLRKILRENKDNGTLPRMYFACGKNDFLYDRFTEFRNWATEIGLDAVFEETEGYTHEWRFWDLAIQHALTFFGLDEKDEGNPY